MSNEPGARPEECGAGAPAGNVPSLRDWHPDADVPPGLTLDDLASVAGMIGAWANEPGEDWSGIHLVAKVYRELSAAAESRRGRMRRSESQDGVAERREYEDGAFYWLDFKGRCPVVARCLAGEEGPAWELPGRVGLMDSHDFAEEGIEVGIGACLGKEPPGLEPAYPRALYEGIPRLGTKG